MKLPFDLLLGRRTFELWSRFWPQHNDMWPGVNTATKYVASNTMTSHEWQPTVFLNGGIAGKIAKIKQQARARLRGKPSTLRIHSWLPQGALNGWNGWIHKLREAGGPRFCIFFVLQHNLGFPIRAKGYPQWEWYAQEPLGGPPAITINAPPLV